MESSLEPPGLLLALENPPGRRGLERVSVLLLSFAHQPQAPGQQGDAQRSKPHQAARTDALASPKVEQTWKPKSLLQRKRWEGMQRLHSILQKKTQKKPRRGETFLL